LYRPCRVSYFDSTTSLNTFWVPLSDLDFNERPPVKKVTMAGGKVYVGNAASKFEPTQPFTFLFGQNELTGLRHRREDGSDPNAQEYGLTPGTDEAGRPRISRL
jgi:hypothetical protein